VELYRLPSYSPQLNVLECFWKVLRRATHNRLLAALAALERSIRNSLSYFQTMRHRIYSLLANCYPLRSRQL
jgi:transposase